MFDSLPGHLPRLQAQSQALREAANRCGSLSLPFPFTPSKKNQWKYPQVRINSNNKLGWNSLPRCWYHGCPGSYSCSYRKAVLRLQGATLRLGSCFKDQIYKNALSFALEFPALNRREGGCLPYHTGTKSSFQVSQGPWPRPPPGGLDWLEYPPAHRKVGLGFAERREGACTGGS